MASPWLGASEESATRASEFFRVDQRVEQVNGEQNADREADDGFDHGANAYSRSQASA
jgi:hypothetical protein